MGLRCWHARAYCGWKHLRNRLGKLCDAIWREVAKRAAEGGRVAKGMLAKACRVRWEACHVRATTLSVLGQPLQNSASEG